MAKGASLDEVEVMDMLKREYPDLISVWRVLFMAITGGVDWRDIFHDWRRVGRFYSILFMIYIFIMQFGVLNIVTSTFVAATSRIASKDREEIVRSEIRRMEDYMMKVVRFFHDLDTHNSGVLTWDDFQASLDNVQVKAYFQALELDVSQAQDFFEMLDTDNSDAVGIDEFIEGCVRLRGGARSVDVNMVLLHCRKLLSQVRSLNKKSQKQLDMMSVMEKDAARKQSGSRCSVSGPSAA